MGNEKKYCVSCEELITGNDHHCLICDDGPFCDDCVDDDVCPNCISSEEGEEEDYEENGDFEEA